MAQHDTARLTHLMSAAFVDSQPHLVLDLGLVDGRDVSDGAERQHDWIIHSISFTISSQRKQIYIYVQIQYIHPAAYLNTIGPAS